MILSEEQKAAIELNRQNYATLKAAGQGVAPRALPDLTGPNAAPVAAEAIIHRETIPGGWYWTTRLARGEALRLTNVEGNSAASLIAWSEHDRTERLNHADTVKVQWSASLRKGRVIFSDMGRVLFSIIEDTCGAHDALVGGSTAASNARKFGGDYRNTRDNFVLAAGKLGFSRADIPSCVTFFAPVAVDASGLLVWNEAHRAKSDFVDLRAEMDVLVAISNCPHPLDPAESYAPGPLEVVRYRAPAQPDDFCRTGSAEAVRGFENNDLLTLA